MKKDPIDEALLLAAQLEDPTGEKVVYVPPRREHEQQCKRPQERPAK